MRLEPLLHGQDEDPIAQREEAWTGLSVAIHWAAKALKAVGVDGTDTTPIHDSETAFSRAQHLEGQLFALSQIPGFHDRHALLVDAVKRACYAAAELGPIQGGRLGSVRRPTSSALIVPTVAPREADLQEVGSELGEALYRLNELDLGDIATEGAKAIGGL